MDGAIAVFVKTPGLSPIKTQLAAAIGEDNAAYFYDLAMKGIAEVVSQFTGRHSDKTQAYWALAETQNLSESYWQGFPIVVQKGQGFGERVHSIYEELRRRHDVVMLLVADCPQITADEIAQVYEDVRQKPEALVLGPTLEQRVWLIAAGQYVPASFWAALRKFESCPTMDEIAGIGSGASIERVSMHVDVATKDDLVSLTAALESLSSLTPAQSSLLAWLDLGLT